MMALIDRRGWEEISGFMALLALSAARHWPLPFEDSPGWYCLFFDVMQDLGHNPDRAGTRRRRAAAQKTMAVAAGADAK